jgi:hypothetical protein
MTTIELTLPDQLALEAQRAGLLSASRLERWLREELKRQHGDAFFEALDRMAVADDLPVMTPADVAEEIAAMRAQRRATRPD